MASGGKNDPETEEMLEQIEKLQLLEKRTKELVEQRRLERACLEQECAKMERQKKYLLAMLKENEAVAEEDRKKEEARRPFSGRGNVLAAPTLSPDRVSDPPPPRIQPLVVDSTLPIGSIQVRLFTGSRLVVKINHRHTIKDLKQEIRARQPAEAETGRDFVIVTTDIPPKKLENLSLSVAEAGLIDSTVLQRLL